MSTRIIAVDWSGRKTREAKYIWLAEARDGVLLRLEGGRDREQIVKHLIELQRSGDRLVAGLDFGFSLPEWFLRECGFGAARELWRWLAADGCADSLLRDRVSPFWGRGGTKKPSGIEHFRLTERVSPRVGAIGPKSIFQINGAGAVGTGSVRGMRSLHALVDDGFAIWPFDVAATSTVVEIYPRLLTGPVNKRDFRSRDDYLRKLGLEGDFLTTAASTEDAFDAAVSAIAMSCHEAELSALPAIDDRQLRIEGIIWWPGWREAHGC